jgi:F420H(2)-dependent quinone reductase
MSDDRKPKAPWLPPRWVIRLAWSVHRGMYRFSGGRLGLRRPRPGHYGLMRLTTIGRRSGQERSVLLGYYEDGPNLVTMAMNGWGAPEPAWWLNLRAQPAAKVDLAGGARLVRGRAAVDDEHTRLWARWREIDTDLDGFAALRPTPTAVVVLEPRAEQG